MRSFDRILDFDVDTNEVVVEAGMSLTSLFEFLWGRRRLLAVQPGHGQISIGGCIAANVHGKNPFKDGTFCDQVIELKLFHPAHGLILLSRSLMPEIFEATCGGYGLTGIILSARLSTQALPGTSITLRSTRIETPEAGAVLMSQVASTHAIVYSWHDFIGSAGEAIVVTGNFDSAFESTTLHAAPNRVLSAQWRAKLPFSLNMKSTGRMVNFIFGRMNGPGSRQVAVLQALFPSQGKEAYFQLFGRAGFHEYQALVPEHAFGEYVERLRRAARKYGVPISLASGKAFGGLPKHLRFAGQGVCFAVNFPRSASSLALLGELDEIALALGCRNNIIKDSRLPRSVVEASYPEYESFKRTLHDWDPDRLFRSELSNRLGL